MSTLKTKFAAALAAGTIASTAFVAPAFATEVEAEPAEQVAVEEVAADTEAPEATEEATPIVVAPAPEQKNGFVEFINALKDLIPTVVSAVKAFI